MTEKSIEQLHKDRIILTDEIEDILRTRIDIKDKIINKQEEIISTLRQTIQAHEFTIESLRKLSS